MPQFPTFEVPALWAAREQRMWDSSECTGWGDTPAPLHFSPLPSYSWSSTECHQGWDFLSQGNHKCITNSSKRQESDWGCWPGMVLLVTASPAERTPAAVMMKKVLNKTFCSWNSSFQSRDCKYCNIGNLYYCCVEKNPYSPSKEISPSSLEVSIIPLKCCSW